MTIHLHLPHRLLLRLLLLLLHLLQKVEPVIIKFDFYVSSCSFLFNVDDTSYNSDDVIQEAEEEYSELCEALARKWLFIQHTHHVSASATNEFWSAAIDLLPDIFQMKFNYNIKKKIPGFEHVRRKLNDDLCPEIDLKFVYQKRNDDSIEVVHCQKAPVKQYPKTSYKKLYEEAHIKVINISIIMLLSMSFIKGIKTNDS